MMDLHEAAKVLRAHQAWRKGGDGPQTDVTLLTQALDAAVAALEGLKDPAVVLVNMMRGTIANPHADTAARCDALAEENALLREYLELAASAKTVAWMSEGRQPDCHCDTIIERARELIGLHLSEQEGMIQPTAAQFMAAVDALAQAIGAAEATPKPEEIPTLEEMREILRHPRERSLSQDASNNDHEDDAA